MGQFPREPLNYSTQSGMQRPSGLAIASLVLGIISVPGVIVYCTGAVIGIIAVALGAAAIAQCNRNPSITGKGMAIAGITLGAISILLVAACGVLVFSSRF